MFSVIGFIVIYLRQLRNRFEYVFESFEYILLISAPLIVGGSLVVDEVIKNYFLMAYIFAIVCWLIFWLFIKKGDTKVETKIEEEKAKIKLARAFSLGMYCGFIVIGLLVFRLRYALTLKGKTNHYNVKLLRGYGVSINLKDKRIILKNGQNDITGKSEKEEYFVTRMP